MPKEMPKQCFRLDQRLIASVTRQEVEASYAAMAKMGIAKAPYPLFDIMVPMSWMFSNHGEDQRLKPEGEIIARYTNEAFVDLLLNRTYWRKQNGEIACEAMPFYSLFDEAAERRIHENAVRLGWTQEKDKDFVTMCQQAGIRLYKLLIVLLATRNTVRTTRVDQMWQAGYGRDRRHKYVTTVSIGKIIEEPRHSVPSGLVQLPQLRSGHVKRQHYGPGRQFVKQIWVAPYFTHVDQEFINRREAYNVSLTERQRVDAA